ncbi:hypothetical protein OHB12_05165 [Nocardia sp. NBC_01730]|uniref:hypothetical protein n=1 Tax=Nocardia sp. NBC_01730 TaxID=2975998 RepID=UPI002E0F8479|nr:hypothetical protein OHB12_05165 [Nocardia sp. NBC_01730]
MQITEDPRIDDVIATARGYQARSLCLVDGQPADLTLIVDTTTPERSRYTVHVFDQMSLRWCPILRASAPDFGPMPSQCDDVLTVIACRKLATQLHDVAEWVLRTARDLGPRW